MESSPYSTEIGMLTVYPHLSCSLSTGVYVNCHCFKCGEMYDRAHSLAARTIAVPRHTLHFLLLLQEPLPLLPHPSCPLSLSPM